MSRSLIRLRRPWLRARLPSFLQAPWAVASVVERFGELGRGGAQVGQAGLFHLLGGLGQLLLEGLGFLAVELGIGLFELLGGLVVLAVLEGLAGPVERLGRGQRLAECLHLGVDQADVELGLLGGDGRLHLGELGQRLLDVDARLLHLLDRLGELLDQLLELGVVFFLGGLFEVFEALLGLLGGGQDDSSGSAGLAWTAAGRGQSRRPSARTAAAAAYGMTAGTRNGATRRGSRPCRCCSASATWSAWIGVDCAAADELDGGDGPIFQVVVGIDGRGRRRGPIGRATSPTSAPSTGPASTIASAAQSDRAARARRPASARTPSPIPTSEPARSPIAAKRRTSRPSCRRRTGSSFSRIRSLMASCSPLSSRARRLGQESTEPNRG